MVQFGKNFCLGGYPLPPRSPGIMELEGNRRKIDGAQAVTRKILRNKELRGALVLALIAIIYRGGFEFPWAFGPPIVMKVRSSGSLIPNRLRRDFRRSLKDWGHGQCVPACPIRYRRRDQPNVNEPALTRRGEITAEVPSRISRCKERAPLVSYIRS